MRFFQEESELRTKHALSKIETAPRKLLLLQDEEFNDKKTLFTAAKINIETIYYMPENVKNDGDFMFSLFEIEVKNAEDQKYFNSL